MLHLELMALLNAGAISYLSFHFLSPGPSACGHIWLRTHIPEPPFRMGARQLVNETKLFYSLLGTFTDNIGSSEVKNKMGGIPWLYH